ncbi:uncharacterized protein PV09_08526 [Verruconis gallopava]|uniref:Peptidase S54 rhomboid domain-containing protein n=1 Tax=Verruconis gallopava TaxID=253628 RepID=A0A0D2ALA7_9PEZI|nr:uncharacterized protein PV09_08526 [Verruconis gallopava]KIV99858.1 hypothetical protein PV09_08526 [Verruconis gallopava]
MLRPANLPHFSYAPLQPIFASQRPYINPYLAQNFWTRHVRRVQSSSAAQGAYLRSVRSKKALVWLCIGTNCIVWLSWQASRREGGTSKQAAKIRKLGLDLQKNFLLATRNVREGRWWVLITSAFSHISFWHLFVNMFTFQQLSQVLVYTPGLTASRHLAPLIFGSALAGSAAFLSHESASSRSQRVGLGFSGVVSGVVTSAACLMPHQQMLLFGVVPLPLWALAIGYIAYDTYAMDGDTSVAHDAHVGGAIFGGAFYMLALKRFGGILGPRMR